MCVTHITAKHRKQVAPSVITNVMKRNRLGDDDDGGITDVLLIEKRTLVPYLLNAVWHSVCVDIMGTILFLDIRIVT